MTHELARRIAFTIGALLVLLLGQNIPITGMWTSNGPLLPGAALRRSVFPEPYSVSQRGDHHSAGTGAIAIFVLAFICTAYVVNPEHAADSLHQQGGVIPGVAPGER